MRTIWKYPMTMIGDVTHHIPERASFLDVQVQYGRPQMWFLVDSDAAPEPRRFEIFRTGHELPDRVLVHLGTFQVQGGDLFFHLFETVTP